MWRVEKRRRYDIYQYCCYAACIYIDQLLYSMHLKLTVMIICSFIKDVSLNSLACDGNPEYFPFSKINWAMSAFLYDMFPLLEN